MNACPICGLVKGLHGSILPGCTCASGTWTTQKKEWIGLTKEERRSIFDSCESEDRGYVLAMTEAKLKEKNS